MMRRNQNSRLCVQVVSVLLALIILRYIISFLFSSSGVSRSTARPYLPSFRILPKTHDAEEGDESGVIKEIKFPRIIHQTWKTQNIPFLFKDWVSSWLKYNPTWQYWFWTDDDIRNLVATNYPDYLRLFDSYPTGGYRADAFRYFVLYEHGGFYADLDAQCTRSLDPLPLQDTCVVAQEPVEHWHFLNQMEDPLVSNAVMACRPKHPFFAKVISSLPLYTGRYSWNGILHATGPFMLTKEYSEYHTSGWFGSVEEPVRLAKPAEFLPTIDTSRVDRIREMCIEPSGHYFMSASFVIRQAKLCARIIGFNFYNGPTNESYTDHHWTHLWATRKHDPWGVKNSDMTFKLRDVYN